MYRGKSGGMNFKIKRKDIAASRFFENMSIVEAPGTRISEVIQNLRFATITLTRHMDGENGIY